MFKKMFGKKNSWKEIEDKVANWTERFNDCGEDAQAYRDLMTQIYREW